MAQAIPTTPEDEGMTPEEREGFNTFAEGSNAPLSPPGAVRGWYVGHARCYGMGVKAAILTCPGDEADNPFPRFSAAGEAWAQGHDETAYFPPLEA